MKRPAKRQRTQSPRFLRHLPSDLLEAVAAYTEYAPQNRIAWKEWAKAEERQCARRTAGGRRCVHYGEGHTATTTEGCARYCLGAEACVAWLEDLLTSLVQVEEVQANGKVLLVQTAVVEATRANPPPYGRLYIDRMETRERAWAGPDLHSGDSRQAALSLCQRIRRDRADALTLTLEIQEDPSLQGVVEPTFRSSTRDFRAEALPRRWVASAGSYNYASSLVATIDLRDAETRGCELATSLGWKCLDTGQLPVQCAAYCLRQDGPCHNWVMALSLILDSIDAVVLTYHGPRQDQGGEPTVVLSATPLVQVLDAKSRPLVQLTLSPVDGWSTIAGDGQVVSLGSVLEETGTNWLCEAISRPTAQDLRIAVDLDGPEPPGSDSATASDYSFEIQWNQSYPNVPFKWKLRRTGNAAEKRFQLEALVPLRPR